MSATAIQSGAAFPRGAAMPRAREFRAYLTETKYECIRMLRTPGFSIPFLGIPVLLFLLFDVVLFGSAVRNDPDSAKYLFTAFAVLGMMGPGMFGFGMALAVEREQGLLKLKRALPMPPASFLVAKMLMAMLFGFIIMVTMIPAALTLGHVPLSIGQIFSVTGLCVLGTIPFSAIGLLIGSLAGGKSAAAYVNIIYQVMLQLSGLFYPLPKFLRTIAPVWPTHHLQQLVMRSIGAPSSGQPIIHILILIGVTLLCAALAMRRLARFA
jgi:ABC-2 type transport system permease protein